MKSSLPWWACCFLMYLVVGIRAQAQGLPEATIRWTGLENLQWANAANWSPARIPNASDHVVVEAPSGTSIQLTGGQSIGSLRLGNEAGSGVVLNVQGTLTLGSGGEVGSGGRVVQTGSLSGGALVVAGEYEWQTGRLFGVLRITSTGRLLLPDRTGRDFSSGNGGIPATIENNGEVRWLGGMLRSWDSSQWVNRGTVVLEGQGRLFDYCCGGAMAQIVNQGRIVKTGVAGDADFSEVTLNSSGTIQVDAGVLLVPRGANWTGTNRVVGAGRLRIVDGTHTWSGTVQADGVLEIAAGSHVGTMTIQGPTPVEWTGGRLYGRLEVGEDSRLQIHGPNGKSMSSGNGAQPATILNRGVVTWQGSAMVGWDASRVVNEGRWELEQDGEIMGYCCGGARPTFVNNGTLAKTAGPGAAVFTDLNVDNSGTMEVGSGTIEVRSTALWRDGSRLTGVGNLRLTGGNSEWTGRMILGGELDLAGANVLGTPRFVGPVPMLWTAGRVYGVVTVEEGVTLGIEGLAGKSLSSANASSPANILNRGTIAWSGAAITAWDSSIITNTGVWKLDSGGPVIRYCCGGGSAAFVNEGTLLATVPETVDFETVRIINRGVVQSGAGRMRFLDQSTWHEGGQIAGDGAVVLTGSATFDGVQFLNGQLVWEGVSLYGSGRFRGPVPVLWNSGRVLGQIQVEPGARLNVRTAGGHSLSSGTSANPASLTNRGTVSIEGTQITAWDSSQISNEGTFRLDSDGPATGYCCGGGVATLINHGVLAKTGGTGVTTLDTVNLDQRGVVSAASGVLQLSYHSSWAAGSRVEGLGTVALTGGNMNAAGLVTLSAPLEVAGANLVGNLAVVGAAPLRLKAGRLYNQLQIEQGGRMEILSPVSFSSGSASTPATLTNRGVVRMIGTGTITAWDATRVANEGEWWLENDGNVFGYCCGGSRVQFSNSGSLAKAGATGASVFDAASFASTGEVRMETGTLVLPATATLGGRTVVRPPAAITGSQFLALSGSFTLLPPADPQPGPGTGWNVITAPVRSGQFADVTVPEHPEGWTWSIDYTPTAVRAVVLEDACLAGSLAGWWPGEGSTVDLTGKQPGSAVGALTYAPGVVGQAFRFTGQNEGVTLGGWSPGTEWTTELWVQLETVQPGRRVLLAGIGSCRDWGLVAVDGTLGAVFRPTSGCSSSVMATAPATPGLWYHVAATCDGTTLKFYLDGQLVGSAAVDPGYVPVANPTIGRAPGGGESFNGWIDEPSIYQRPLGAGEIAAIYDSATRGRCARSALAVTRVEPSGPIQTNVARVRVRFNQPIQPATFTVDDVRLTGPTGALDLASAVIESTPDPRGYALVFATELSNEGDYTLVIGPNILDVGGQAFAGGLAHTNRFQIDRSGPRLVSLTPASPAAGKVSFWDLTFSTPVVASSFTAADVKVTGAGFPGIRSVNLLSNVVWRVTFSAPLPAADYEVAIGPEVVDAAGNRMDQDADGVAGEPQEDVYRTTYQVLGADLAVLSVTGPPSGLLGQSVPVVLVVSNRGPSTAIGPWNHRIQLAADASGASPFRLGEGTFEGTLASGATLVVTQQVILGNGSAGTRHLMVVVDPEERTIDPDRSNNTRVAVVPTVVHAADLRVTGLEVTNVVELGGGMVVRWRTTNPGGSDTTASGRDAVFLSPSADSLAGAVLLGSFAGTPVATGGGYDRTVTVTVPLRPDQIAVGPAFLVVMADVDNAQPEADESNNRASVAVTVVAPPLPDLTVNEVQVPQFSGGGVETELRWTVRNVGTAPVAGAWDERWVMQVPGSAPLSLSVFRFTNSLPAGGFISRTQFVVLPPFLAAGSYTMTATVDPQFEVVESSVANNTAASATRMVIPAALTLEGSEFALLEGAPAQMFRVHRNSDTSVPLTVVLTNPVPSEIELPESVVIPAGQSVAEFPVKALVDGITDGARLVLIEASAAGHAAAPLAVPTEDIDRPTLTLETAPDRVVEGQTLPVTIRRTGPIGSEALVLLRSSDSTRVTLPSEVTIPAGSATTSFALLTVNDTVLQVPAAVDLVAISGGYVGDTNRITVVDDDIPQVTATVSAAELNEAGGPQAGYVTFRRSGSLERALVMDLVVTVDDLLLVAPTATFEAGSDAVTVSVGVLNDTLLNGRRQVALRVFLRATGRLDTVAEAAPVELAVIDDEGPTLTLTLGSDVAGEGRSPAFSGTVRRNTGTNAPLTVTLRSADVTEATVPATVVIPAGAASATFPVVTVDDGVADGSQTVAIEASAVGFTGSTVSFVVSDTSLPDLSVTRVQVPVTGDSESAFNVTYRVENRGNIATDKGFVTRVLLSSDPVPGGDTLLGQYFFEGSIPRGQFFEQTSQFRLPRHTGRFWVIVVTDATGVVGELREDNNTTVATVPIEVKPSYVATVATDVDQAMPGTPIPLRGRAVRAGSEQGVPNVAVNVHVEVRGTRRIVTALTDSTGSFEAVFRPLPSEAGRYTIGAAHPGEASAAVQDRFSLIGFAMESRELAVEMSVGGFDIVVVDLVNLSEVPLTGLRVEPVALPSHLGVQATLGLTTLGGDSTNSMLVRVEATGAATTFGKFGLKVTSNEGAVVEIPVTYSIRVPRPLVVVRPGSLVAGMVRGRQTAVGFDVVNLGAVATEPMVLSLPDFPWVAVAGDNPIPAIQPGGTNHVTLLLTPPADLELGAYAGAMALNSSTAGASLPFEFRALSDAKGTLLVQVEDEFTYYAEGNPRVTNATVVVRDLLSGVVVTNGVTDALGEFLLRDVPEAYYEVEISADKHTRERLNPLVAAGQTNLVTAFLSRQTVEYNWTVVPTEIEDRTSIVIETIFETVVPVPVVTVEPSFIDLLDFTGDEMQVDIAISNHGLIAAQDMNIGFDAHPDFTFTPLVSELGTLPAQSSLVVPVTIRRVGGNGGSRGATVVANRLARPAAGTGPCWGGGRVKHTLKCGKLTPSYTTGISVRTGSNCGGASGSSGGIGGGGGGGYGGGGGVASGGNYGQGFGVRRSIAPKESCDCDPATFVPRCFEIGVSGGLLGGAISSATTAILAPANGAAEVKANGSVKICSCCDEEGEGYKLEGTAEAEGAVTVTIPLLGKKFKSSRSEGAATVVLEAGIGCDFTLAGKIKVSANGSTDCHYKNPKVCVTATLEVPGGISCGTVGSITVIGADGSEATQGVNLSVGVTGGMSGSYTRCNGKTTGKMCINAVNAEAVAQASFGDLSVGGKFVQEVRAEECHEFEPGSLLPDAPEFIVEVMRQMEELADRAEQEFRANVEKSSPKAAAPRTPTRIARIGNRNAAPAAGEEGICARVKLRLEQELVLTRSAFRGTLELINKDPLNGLDLISVSVQVYDTNGRAATDLFGFRPPQLSGLDAIDGTGTLGPDSTGSATFILVPTRDAAPEAPTQYGVGGYLTYRIDGKLATVPLVPVTITVFPDPRLVVQYFHQRDVFSDDPFTRDVIEPTVPFNLAVMVANRGKGDARNVRIISSQPEIVENEKGLAIDFKIIATEVAGKSLTPGLTADFGLIAGGDIGIGRWLLTSTLQGLFLDYSATFEHLDSLGKTNLSLVEAVTIHEMNRLVEAGGAFSDGKPDFLVNDWPDADDLPDTLYLSDGRTNAVTMVVNAEIAGTLAGANRQVQMTASVGDGWSYFRLPDPANGRFRLKRVTRSDGFEVSVQTNAWTTDRTFIGRGKRPTYENILHLLDHDSTGRYVLEYEDLPSMDLVAPVSRVAALPTSSYATIPLTWTGGDEPGGSGLAGFDVFVSVDDGPFTPWLPATQVRGAVYRGEPGRRYAFYSIASDKAGNREEAPLQPDAVTRVNLANVAPTIAAVDPVSVDEGSPVTVQLSGNDPDLPSQTLTWSLGSEAPAGVVIEPATGRLTWETGEGNGPSVVEFRVMVRDSGVPALSATNTVRITVREVNRAPVLLDVADAQVNEGQVLSFALSAVDADRPTQSLNFQLEGTVPAGMTVHPLTGVVRWVPGAAQGGRTYGVTARVTDNGVPPLSASTTFRVAVRDTQGDFALRLGTTNVLRGGSASIPVDLETPLELSALRFGLSVPVTALEALQLAPVAVELGTATVVPDGPGHSRLEFTAANGATFLGAQRLAQLGFTAPAGDESVALKLAPESVEAVRVDGVVITRPRVVPGRVFVLGDAPLLDLVVRGVTAEIHVYGRAGLRYEVESTDALEPGATWVSEGTHTSTGDVWVIPFTPAASGDGYFRSRRLP